jgi:hypothetical protein
LDPPFAGEGVLLRLVSYRLPDGKLIRVLTDRFDLSAVSVAQLYKERWSIENWWKWVKQMFKIKRPIGESENALPVQIVSAFVTDVLLRAFNHSRGFTSSLYEFVSNCQELSLVPLKELTNGALRRALETILGICLASAHPHEVSHTGAVKSFGGLAGAVRSTVK